jgi:hypothetical protein
MEPDMQKYSKIDSVARANGEFVNGQNGVGVRYDGIGYTKWELWLQENGSVKDEYLLEPFIIKDTINLWAGGYGWGKSTIAINVAVHLAALWVADPDEPNARNLLAVEGKDEWCGLPIYRPNGEVLYITEETERNCAIRWRRMLNAYGLRGEERLLLNGGITSVTFNHLRERYKGDVFKGILKAVTERGAGLVVVDTFGHLIGDDINKYNVITQTFQRLQPVLDAGCTVLLIDHTAKQYYSENEGQQEGLTPIGSGQKLGQARHLTTIRFIERITTADPHCRGIAVRMEITKSNHTETGVSKDLDLFFDSDTDSQWISPSSLRGVDGEIVELLKERGQMKRKDIVEAIDESKDTVIKRLSALVRAGKIFSPKYGYYAVNQQEAART